MFTGIIEGLGTLKDIRPVGKGIRLSIESGFDLLNTKIGDSIAVNGACLTAVKIEGRSFEVDVAPETMSLTTFAKAKPGDRVNLERALRLSDRLDGHLVSGHIDGMGIIKSKKTLSNAVIVTISLPPSLTKYMIHKGSVAIDGISLTINNCSSESIELSIIPHSAKLTTIGFKKAGDEVNIETDVVGKYIEKFVTGNQADSDSTNKSGQKASISKEFLAKSGFF
jgi:riboflavin synthase